MDTWERYFKPAIEHLESTSSSSSSFSVTSAVSPTHAAVYREFAIFAERQYYALIRSPDSVRFRLYVDRKRKEIDQRSNEIMQTQPGSARDKLRQAQERAQKLLDGDWQEFEKHKTTRNTLLLKALEMHSRVLQVTDEFDTNSAIRFCSLWFSNFEEYKILGETVQKALERIPSRKLVFLAVGSFQF